MNSLTQSAGFTQGGRDEGAAGSIKVSVIIPAHNEAGRIGAPLEAYAKHFYGKYGDSSEILVVTNNCSDETEKVVEGISKHYSNVHQVVIHERIGKGGAVVEGFKRARGDAIGFVDADGSTPPEEFDRLFQFVGRSDCVIGSRRVKGAVIPIPQGFFRRALGRGFNILVRLLFGFPYRDTQCGAKVFKRGSLMTVLGGLTVSDYAFDVNLLYLFYKHGFSILEVPTLWYNREGSTLTLYRIVPQMFAAVVRLRLKNSSFGRFL